jgi:hypothetical protein
MSQKAPSSGFSTGQSLLAIGRFAIGEGAGFLVFDCAGESGTEVFGDIETGEADVGADVTGAVEVGEDVRGNLVVGEGVNGAFVVGDDVTGALVVGANMVGGVLSISHGLGISMYAQVKTEFMQSHLYAGWHTASQQNASPSRQK